MAAADAGKSAALVIWNEPGDVLWLLPVVAALATCAPAALMMAASELLMLPGAPQTSTGREEENRRRADRRRRSLEDGRAQSSVKHNLQQQRQWHGA